MAGPIQVLAAADPLNDAAWFLVFLIVALLLSVFALVAWASVSRFRHPRLPVSAAGGPGLGPGTVGSETPLRAFPVVGPMPAVALEVVPPPAADDQPGLFRVVGVEGESGADFAATIPALSMANARVKAELKGVIVTSIARQEPADPVENPFAA